MAPGPIFAPRVTNTEENEEEVKIPNMGVEEEEKLAAPCFSRRVVATSKAKALEDRAKRNEPEVRLLQKELDLLRKMLIQKDIKIKKLTRECTKLKVENSHLKNLMNGPEEELG